MHNYLLPRDCPRVTFYAKEDTSPDDIKRLMRGTTAKCVVAIETASFHKTKEEIIYKYAFDKEDFELVDEGAGYYVSRTSVKPKSVQRLSDILVELLKHDVELRVMPSLWELREEVINSTMQYSIIRMNRATPPTEGYGKYHPLP